MDVPVFGVQEPGVSYTERIAAYGVIRSSDGERVAAVRGRTAYFLPGGGREGDETAEETVCREVREEVGRGVRLTGLIGEAIQYFFAASDDRHFGMRATFFAAEFVDGGATRGEEILHWVAVSEAEAAFFHACHAWAVRQSAWRELGALGTFERVRALLAASFDLAPVAITPQFSLREQMTVDSLGMVEMLILLEQEFGVVLSDEDGQPVDTVADVVRLIEERGL